MHDLFADLGNMVVGFAPTQRWWAVGASVKGGGETLSDNMVTILVSILGSGALATIVNQVCVWWNKREERKSGVSEGMRLILKDRIRFLCMHYIRQGWIYSDELEDLMAMHNCYHNKLNGNGYLDELMNRVKRLDIKDE